MPGVDGYETCARLKGDPGTQGIPIIFVTAKNDAESESRALAAGAVDFIHKPVNRDVLLARVRLHLGIKVREQELSQRLAEIEAIYNTAPVGLCVLGPDCSYRRINRRLAEFGGAPAGAHIGRTAHEMVPDLAGHAESIMARILNTGEPMLNVEMSGETARDPGVQYHYLTHWYPLKQDGYTYAVNLTVEDITSIKRIEIALREQEASLQAVNENLARMDQRKSEFLATLAHELRNPLAPIRNGVHVLRMLGDKAQADEEATHKLFDILERQVKHLTRLVDDLLEVSRINAGKIELRTERTDLRAVVGQAIDISRALIDAQHHTLEVSLPPEPLHVEGDPVRLAQVLANLLNNAAKYMDAQGRIQVHAARQGSEVVVSVRDQGIGIAAELLPRVFDCFTQADNGVARAQGGLGIGLALVRSLVEMHGGTVTAHSGGLGCGSEFTVRLPVLAEPA